MFKTAINSKNFFCPDAGLTNTLYTATTSTSLPLTGIIFFQNILTNHMKKITYFFVENRSKGHELISGNSCMEPWRCEGQQTYRCRRGALWRGLSTHFDQNWVEIFRASTKTRNGSNLIQGSFPWSRDFFGIMRRCCTPQRLLDYTSLDYRILSIIFLIF